MNEENRFFINLTCAVCERDDSPSLFYFGGDEAGRCLDCYNDALERSPRNIDAEWDERTLGMED